VVHDYFIGAHEHAHKLRKLQFGICIGSHVMIFVPLSGKKHSKSDKKAFQTACFVWFYFEDQTRQTAPCHMVLFDSFQRAFGCAVARDYAWELMFRDVDNLPAN
jgi:hypothetical protein